VLSEVRPTRCRGGVLSEVRSTRCRGGVLPEVRSTRCRGGMLSIAPALLSAPLKHLPPPDKPNPNPTLQGKARGNMLRSDPVSVAPQHTIARQHAYGHAHAGARRGWGTCWLVAFAHRSVQHDIKGCRTSPSNDHNGQSFLLGSACMPLPHGVAGMQQGVLRGCCAVRAVSSPADHLKLKTDGNIPAPSLPPSPSLGCTCGTGGVECRGMRSNTGGNRQRSPPPLPPPLPG
jgi:hypothetical protein